MSPQIPSTSTIAAHLRPWTTPHPSYAPVDVTSPALRRLALATGLARDWAELVHDPRRINWRPRQDAALISFTVADNMPLNPTGRTGRCGRQLGRWGENAAADPIVIADTPTGPHLLLIARDCGRWAIPGGMVDPGETAAAALVRELWEETSVDLTGVAPQVIARTYVDDPRNTDHAWICTTAAVYRVPQPLAAVAGDDATDARWWPCHTPDALQRAVTAAGGTLYPAHVELLHLALAESGLR